MEVHAHSHTERKKWTHYFWEFLMLFLAVFCGFLAEYQLEHKIEKDRIKKYMKDMIADLHADTAFINFSLGYASETVQKLDSFVQNLYSDAAFSNTKILYKEYYDYFRLLTPALNDQTITQLRSAGNLRLINSEEITNKLSEYWNGFNALKKVAERVEQRYDVSAQLASRIFNRKYFYTYGSQDSLNNYPESGAMSKLAPMLLMTNDKNDLIAFANIVDRIKLSIAGPYREHLSAQHQLALALIALIKKEYHFN
jgi:hypothetical protein